ncbi:MAG: hypothetical protein LBJ58_04595 [Tannerellaceae bacterium]|jgi:hypothetical protein|nr:hypothetical protein [Tannerellaceae bacterium]
MFAAEIKGALQAFDEAGNRRDKKMKSHGHIFTEYPGRAFERPAGVLARASSPKKVANFLKKAGNFLKKAANFLKKAVNFLKKAVNFLKKVGNGLRYTGAELCILTISTLCPPCTTRCVVYRQLSFYYKQLNPI